jgi:dipeptidase
MVHQYTLLLEQNPNLRIILRVNQNALEIYRELTKIIEKTGYENSIYVVLDDNDKYTRM